jgi:hypothetical protein
MLPIASLLSNPIPQAIPLTPGLAPVLAMLGLLLVGVVEVFRALCAQRHARRPARITAAPITGGRRTAAIVGNS